MTNKAGDCENKHYYCPVHSTQFHFSPVQPSIVHWSSEYGLPIHCAVQATFYFLAVFPTSKVLTVVASCIIQVGERDITVTLKAA